MTLKEQIRNLSGRNIPEKSLGRVYSLVVSSREL